MLNNDIKMLERLKIDDGILDVIIDTDTFNEIDDQFAVTYALLSKERFNVRGIVACPFFKDYNNKSVSPEDGMEKSYNECKLLLNLMNIESENFLFKGSTRFLDGTNNFERSEGVQRIIDLAMSEYSEEKPLYIIGIAALTDIANAINLEPKIVNRVKFIWLGGRIHSDDCASEFNLHQDMYASKSVFDADLAFTQIPCFGVASHLLTSIYELKACLNLDTPVVNHLVDSYEQYNENHFAYSKEIWDIAPMAYLINADKFTRSSIVRKPSICLDEKYCHSNSSNFMRVITFIERNDIFNDMFTKFNNYGTEQNK